jgi:protein O-GlcNAc transferase
LTAGIFQIWVRLLEATPGSVLWLLASNREMEANLRREAEAWLAGGAESLVFAPTLPNAEHLARLQLADVFLDTLPYNAHTLASDALWAGCPVITCAGKTFASRVAGSLLKAVGLKELVTSCLEDSEALAARLARDPAQLAEIRGKLRANRLSAPFVRLPEVYARDGSGVRGDVARRATAPLRRDVRNPTPEHPGA